MGPAAVIVFAVCLTVLLTHSSCTLWTIQEQKTTSPPGSTCFLPTPPQFGNYTSPLCQYYQYSACTGHPGFVVPDNWVLSFTCSEGYSLEDLQDSSAIVYCVNGEWYPKIPKCQTTCGKKHTCSSTTEYPWHVGLYQRSSNYEYTDGTEEGWTQFCLGTLISSHIVLTAADCVYDDKEQRVRNSSSVKVAIGKRHVEWNHDEPDSVKANVREISVPAHYIGKDTGYAYNIALLNLEDSVNTSSTIMPACFDWNQEITILPGARGTVTGWNHMDEGTVTGTVSDSQLTYIGYRQCVSEASYYYRDHILPDKLCAEHRDGTFLTSSYRGVGLTFVNNGSHYVLGVASSTFKEKNSLTVFTNVTNCELRNWITETKQKFDETHFKADRRCQPLKSLNVDVRCQYKRKDIDCNKTVPVGTEATGLCRMGYLHTGRAANVPIVCKENGQWSHDLVHCVRGAVCMYKILDRPVFSPEMFEVALGKRFRSWTHDEPGAVKAHVRAIAIPPRYHNEDSNYAQDMALIDLETSVPVNFNIMPACVDWSREFHMTPGQIGTLAGWRVTENDPLSYFKIAYEDYTLCFEKMKRDDRRYLSPDKFCSTPINGSVASPAEYRGGGVTFEYNGVHYVKGVRDLILWWNNTEVYKVLFTDFGDLVLLEWLQSTKRLFDKAHNDT